MPSPHPTIFPENSCSTAFFIYHFNGKESDNDWTGNSGDSYDFGARMYDSRLGRWLSVDRYYKQYIPFSPYSFCFNIPTNFRDVDGNVIVDKDGRPVTVSIAEAEDGTISVTYTFADDATPDAIAEFNANGGAIINEMVKSPTGMARVKFWNATATQVSLIGIPSTKYVLPVE